MAVLPNRIGIAEYRTLREISTGLNKSAAGRALTPGFTALDIYRGRCWLRRKATTVTLRLSTLIFDWTFIFPSTRPRVSNEDIRSLDCETRHLTRYYADGIDVSVYRHDYSCNKLFVDTIKFLLKYIVVYRVCAVS